MLIAFLQCSNIVSIISFRITSEIIADLPGIYEMPSEAVGWVERVSLQTVYKYIVIGICMY